MSDFLNKLGNFSVALLVVGLITILWWPTVGAILALLGFMAVLGVLAAAYWWVGVLAKQRKIAKRKAMRAL